MTLQTVSALRQQGQKLALVWVLAAGPAHRRQIEAALRPLFRVVAFDDLDSALRSGKPHPPSVIIVDEKVRPGGGLLARRRLACYGPLAAVPVVCIAAHPESGFAEECRRGNRPVLVSPVPQWRLIARIMALVSHQIEAQWQSIEPLQREALQKSLTLFNTISELVDTGRPIPYARLRESCVPLVKAVSKGTFRDILSGVREHDNYTYAHSLRVATFLSFFGHAVGLRGEDLLTVATGGLLHDVGKITVPPAILNKPASLTADEWVVMRQHVHGSREFLEMVSGVPRGVSVIAEQHHERLDGTGYLKGLSGSELNELARMAAIADVFGALTDRRPYKEPMAPEAALDLMREMTGHLDQDRVSLFRDMLLDAVIGCEALRPQA
jgi:HD-GYP domain-containing protein (c-di-GMP phosphodiesterase class II)